MDGDRRKGDVASLVPVLLLVLLLLVLLLLERQFYLELPQKPQKLAQAPEG